MEDLVLMQVAQTQAHLDEELPYFLLLQGSEHLLLQVLSYIPVLAVLHDDVD